MDGEVVVLARAPCSWHGGAIVTFLREVWHVKNLKRRGEPPTDVNISIFEVTVTCDCDVRCDGAFRGNGTITRPVAIMTEGLEWFRHRNGGWWRVWKLFSLTLALGKRKSDAGYFSLSAHAPK
ncbi:MAG: hypothetical protein ACTS6G_03125 [Candidatus Hodgkinia cicadicola]